MLKETYFLYNGKAKLCLFTNGKSCNNTDNTNCNYFLEVFKFILRSSFVL